MTLKTDRAAPPSAPTHPRLQRNTPIENVEIPPCSTHARFFTDAGRIASRPAELRVRDADPDECAVFSVLQLGAIVPPLSPWPEIRRFLPGYRYSGTTPVGPITLDNNKKLPSLSLDQRSRYIEKLIDSELVKALAGISAPVLLFSGGVDSGFLASRLVALGFRDTLLLNYSFSKNDQESYLAEAMARHLGLQFERLSDTSSLCDSLSLPGRVYSQPFGDFATVSSSALAHAVVDRLGGERRLILDGTGADGAFGLASRLKHWRLVYQIPMTVRRAGSRLYGKALWRNRSWIESCLRVPSRSAQMPLAAAIIGQNPLAGFLYLDDQAHNVHHLLENWVSGWAGHEIERQAVAADLALTCANIFAEKARPLLESAGHSMSFPFLQQEIVATALSLATGPSGEEPKAMLKASLARHVPESMVYRRKSGFADPTGRVFLDQEFLAHLRAVADPTSTLAPMINTKAVIRACDALNRAGSLPLQTLNFLWAIVFTDRWYRTVE